MVSLLRYAIRQWCPVEILLVILSDIYEYLSIREVEVFKRCGGSWPMAMPEPKQPR